MDVVLPVKIIYVKALITQAATMSWKWPMWYLDWYLSAPNIQERYNCTVSPWYDHNSMWLGSQIKFYDMDKYMEFCLTWM